MSADQNVLQGKVSEDPVADRGDVSRLLAGFVLALVREHESSRNAGNAGASGAEAAVSGGEH